MGEPAKRKKKTSGQAHRWNQEKAQEEARKMYEDRLNDMTIRAIAKKYGYHSQTVMNRLKLYEEIAIPEMTVYQWREFEREKLDEMEEKLWDVLYKKHYKVDHGQLIRMDGDEGEPLEDDEMALKTLDRLLKLHERRTKLFGLEAPAQQEITVNHQAVPEELMGVLQKHQEQQQIEKQQILEAEIVEDSEPEPEEPEAEPEEPEGPKPITTLPELRSLIKQAEDGDQEALERIGLDLEEVRGARDFGEVKALFDRIRTMGDDDGSVE